MNGVSHVAIGVRDMDRSLKFYRDLLGLEVRFDAMQPTGGMPSLYADPDERPTPRRSSALWEG